MHKIVFPPFTVPRAVSTGRRSFVHAGSARAAGKFQTGEGETRNCHYSNFQMSFEKTRDIPHTLGKA
jgi:hypothetical protein